MWWLFEGGRGGGVSRQGARLSSLQPIAIIAYHLLSRDATCQDLGTNYFDERARRAVERRAIRRLEALGFKVTLEPAA